MAKAKDLAALAGLGALAYAMRNKDEAPKGKEDTGPGYKSTETREEPRRKIEDYQKKAPLDGTEMYPSGVMGGARQSDSKPALKPVTPVAEPVAAPTKPLATPAQRTDQLANVSRAVKREAKTKQFADEVPYEESAQKTDALRVASRAAAAADARRRAAKASGYKKGGMVSKVSSASKRADGIASRGKTKCKMY